MATSSLPPVIKMEKLECTPNMEVNFDFETIFTHSKSKIKDYFEKIHNAATALELQLLTNLEKFAKTHRAIVRETDRNIKHMNKVLCSVTDSQLKSNLNNEINNLNKNKYTGIHVTVEEQLSEFIGNSISIDIEVASDSNLEKLLSSNPHPVMNYSKQKEMISLETLHAQFSEIRSILRHPDYRQLDKMWYLIGRNWVEEWLNYEDNVEYVNGLIPLPPPIDNSDIMDETESHGLLKYRRKYNTIHVHKNNKCITEELVMGKDFAIFNEAAWGKLVEWYGIKEGTIIFPRRILNLEFPRQTLQMSRLTTVTTRDGTTNISLCLYPNFSIGKFQLFSNNSNFKFIDSTNEIRFFDHDTMPEILTAVKRVLRIPFSSEIIIFREDYSGLCIHPNTNKKYTVISSIVPSSFRNLGCRDVLFLVALMSKETEWLNV